MYNNNNYLGGSGIGATGLGPSGIGVTGTRGANNGLYGLGGNGFGGNLGLGLSPIDRQYYGDQQIVLVRPQGGSSGALGGALDGLDIDYDTFVLLLGLAVAAAAFGLYQIIVTKGRRKRREVSSYTWWLDRLSDSVWLGKFLCYY